MNDQPENVRPTEAQPPLALAPGSAGCPPDCGHTPEEHAAFDRGVGDGYAHGWDCENPYNVDTQYPEWDAWETGVTLGRLGKPDPEPIITTTT